MADRPMDSWRARAAVSESIDVFQSSYMQEMWTKALARREADPEGAVTAARALLETVCKYILEAAGTPYKQGLPLPDLYKLAALELEIAPTQQTEPIFKSLFQACSEIVGGVGRLRNSLSDSHGRGPFGTMPDWRHAELAVNLSGAMATYLAAVWKGRQRTVGDVFGRFIEDRQKTKPLGESHLRSLEKMARSPLGDVIASKLLASDVVAYCESRLSSVTPQTINQDVVYLRGALGEDSAEVIDEALAVLRARNMVGKSTPRARRVTHAEYDALIAYFQKQGRHKKTKIPMGEIMEFAAWSGRTLGDILTVRWGDVDLEKGRCRWPGTKEDSPLLERAADVLRARREKYPNATAGDNIFPYNAHSASQTFRNAKKDLAETTLKGTDNLTFNDFRYDAVTRLLEKGHHPHIVARATGQDIKKVDEIHRKLGDGGVD